MKRALIFLTSPGVLLVRLRLRTLERLYFWLVSPLVVALRQSAP